MANITIDVRPTELFLQVLARSQPRSEVVGSAANVDRWHLEFHIVNYLVSWLMARFITERKQDEKRKFSHQSHCLLARFFVATSQHFLSNRFPEEQTFSSNSSTRIMNFVIRR